MSLIERLTVRKIEDEITRCKALEVLEEVYRNEKAWVTDLDAFFPAEDLNREPIAWFLAEVAGEPVGVTRVLYEIPVELYEAYGFELTDQGLDVEAFLRDHRVAEIGRYAVIPRYRKRIAVAAILMRAATIETVERGFTHFVTDVFETDPNSPMKFHQRILGFQTVATHSVGELNHLGRRVTMVLDVKASFQRLRARNNWLYRFVREGLTDRMFQQMTA